MRNASQPAFLTRDRRESVQPTGDPGRPASPSPQAYLQYVEDSDEDTAGRCGRWRARSRSMVRSAGYRNPYSFNRR